MTREETSKYTDPLADGTARIFSFVMDAKSLITVPGLPGDADRAGLVEINGIAWTGRGKITRVDVSTDGGKTWQPAKLMIRCCRSAHTRFRLPVEMDRRRGGAHEPRDRRDRLRAADATQCCSRRAGQSTAYHFNNIRAWKVAAPTGP